MKNKSPLFPAGKAQSVSDELRAIRTAIKTLDNSQTTAAPRILLTATLRWAIAARLAIAFANLGCRVEILCPREHPATKTRAIQKTHAHSSIWPLLSLRTAIESAEHDLIIPCDDDAAIHLHRLYLHTGDVGFAANSLRTLIARSLGTPEACALAAARGRFMALAAEEGVRIPDTTIVATPSELDTWLAQHGFPAVIKIDSTWGGQGVSIVRNREDAQRAFSLMKSRPAILNAVARTLLNRDLSFFLNLLKKTRRTITLQDFIVGSPANRAVACWRGQVLAGISVQAIRTQHATGPATVVRVIDNTEMAEAANRLVRRLGLSGLWGFDFVLQTSANAAYLIEMNPRATPICHLPFGAGMNLPAALYTQLTGVPPLATPSTIDHDIVAMFPGEWHRDYASPYLRSEYHDIPWDEIALIQYCIDRPWSERGLIARMWARIHPKSPRLPPPSTSSFADTELEATLRMEVRNQTATAQPQLQARSE